MQQGSDKYHRKCISYLKIPPHAEVSIQSVVLTTLWGTYSHNTLGNVLFSGPLHIKDEWDKNENYF